MVAGNKPSISILIVEDVDDTREMYAEFFISQGFEVHTANDGIEALALAKEKRPTVVLLDVALPKLDGLSVLRKIRADKKLADTPVLTISAFTGSEYNEGAEQSGANRVLSKPCLPDEVLKAVREVVGKRKK
jgi:CheY-like chemotaxis protein